MRVGLRNEYAQQYAQENGLILAGFSLAEDHSILLCERGYEFSHSRKKPQTKRKPTEQGLEDTLEQVKDMRGADEVTLLSRRHLEMRVALAARS